MRQTEPDPFMSKFIKPAGTWECSICMIQNNPDITKCEACETPKPTPITKPPSKPLTTTTSSKPDELMAKFMKPTGVWECSTCLVENDAETRKCCACETPRPGQTASTLSDAATRVSQKADPLMAKFMKPAGCWECDVCMVQNPSSSYKCEACQTPNPNAAPPPSSSSGSSGSADVLPKFGSGVVTNSSFKFGSSSDSSVSVTSTEGFKFGSSSTSEATGTFKFGTTSTTSMETSKSFVFGQSAAPAAVDEKKKSSENSGFKFQLSGAPLAASSTAPSTFGSETNTQPSVDKKTPQKSVFSTNEQPNQTTKKTQFATSPVLKRQRDDENNFPADPLMAKFMKPAGCWECDVCMVQNAPSSYKCEACQTPNPNAAPPPPSSGSSALTTTTTSSKPDELMAKFMKPTGAWECSTCLVENDAETRKCCACETPRPGQTASTLSNAATRVSQKADPLMAKFMKPAGCWECDVCMVQNPPSSYKCEACQTPNPNAAPPPPPSSGSSGSANVLSKFGNVINSGFKFGSSFGNSDNARSTEVFKFGRSATSEPAETFKFGTTSTSEKHNQNTMFTASSLKRKRDDDESTDSPAAKFMKPAGCWECDVCMVQNAPSSYKCEACQTPNPNASPPPPSTGSSEQ